MTSNIPASPMKPVPEIRASLAIDCLKVLKAKPEWPQIRDELAVDTLRSVENASRMGWLPLRYNIEMCHAALPSVGLEGVRHLGLETTKQSAETPLLKPIITGAVKLFRLKPRSGVRLIARTLPTLYRNVGQMEVVDEDDDDKVSLLWSQVPSLMTSTAPWLQALCGGFEILFQLCDVEGNLRLEVDEPSEGATLGALHLLFSWR